MVRWAIDNVSDERKLWYNIGITSLATSMALLAAFMQLNSLIADLLPDNHGAYLEFWRDLNSEYVGIVFIALFALGVAVMLIVDARRRANEVVHA